MENKKEYCGIGIDEDGEYYCPTDKGDLIKFWDGMDNICDWISKFDGDKETEEYKAAALDVERLRSWKDSVGGQNYRGRIGRIILNNIFKSAIEFAMNKME